MNISIVNGPIWPKFELVRDFMLVLLTCKFDKDRVKSESEGASVETSFSPLYISQWKLLVAMETNVLIGSVPNVYTAFPPTPVMLHIKFD